MAGAGASLAVLAAPAFARSAAGSAARPDPVAQLLDALPQQVRGLLPQEAFDAADTVRSLIALEAEAKRLRLPRSPLSLAEVPLTTDLDRLYQEALPRLVALIDRSELRNRLFSDKAGELLARLHGTQHVIPFALSQPGALGFDPGPEGIPDYPMPEISVPIPDLFAQDAPVTVNRSLRFADIAAEYEDHFARAQPKPENAQSTGWHLTMMRQARPRYEALSRRMGVPWFFIAAIHGLEASFNFRAHLHNGDFPLYRRTRQVPANRPAVWLPPSDWESSAADALRLMGFTNQSDWSLPRALYRLEAYNGFGYRRLGRISPYLWSFSTLYDRGKFVADGKFSATARSQQCGGAVMLKLLADAGEIAFS